MADHSSPAAMLAMGEHVLDLAHASRRSVGSAAPPTERVRSSTCEGAHGREDESTCMRAAHALTARTSRRRAPSCDPCLLGSDALEHVAWLRVELADHGLAPDELKLALALADEVNHLRLCRHTEVLAEARAHAAQGVLAEVVVAEAPASPQELPVEAERPRTCARHGKCWKAGSQAHLT
eukprot:CAMPEP_0185155008 /NCGR_PEP_ID=MMETSP1139-20130426/160_1 /TAXON_ID=298111 /ORGANISM="Pavlova sp., Strain CCMP459" /LENGTH=179 /DNA_ID=CAMNT_0027719891 /DNA_START=256 /DNA_END=792 /DNA_ORIENTATION=-